jgi:ferredoxin-type protein NapF
MQFAFLKKIRVTVSLVFFLITVFIFVDFTGLAITRLIRGILYLQFVPSLLKFINSMALATAGFIFILGLTLFFGRVYCSTVCPLGTLQDIFTWLLKKFRFLKRVKYSKPQNFIRYPVLLIATGLLFLSSLFILTLLDPYSLAGKLFSNLFRPSVYIANNILARIFQLFGSYSVYSVPVKMVSLPPILFSAAFMILIIYLAGSKGRWYCNTICPVGTSLGLISRISFFRIKMDETACTSCGICAKECKAGCIDVKHKKVDFSRCVACYDCIGACPEKGIGYKFITMKLTSRIQKESVGERLELTNMMTEDPSRRRFFRTAILGTTALLASETVLAGKAKKVSTSEAPVTPPGSVSLWHYTEKCTACHLCVSICPTKVLQPTFMEYGISGMFQPKMNFHAEYCNFECVKCSEVCPTGAILPITKEQKSTLQIGTSQFVKNLCIVVTKHTACGACSEHCPTKAVEMVPYLGDLMIPKVDDKICVGCGACEYACPVKPDKAIYVESNPYHMKASKPLKKVEEKEKKKTIKPTDDFPF